MWAFLPFLNLALLFLLFYTRPKQECREWRESLLSAAVIWGLLFVAGIEMLSLFRALAFQPIRLFWVFSNSITLYFLFKNRRHWHPLKTVSTQRAPLSWIEKACLAGLLILVLAVGLTAIVAPPNTNDVMSYHMSRIMHWIQNQSLDNHPVHNGCQLNHPPGAEYLVTHLQILGGSDRLSNIPQFLALLLALAAVSLISKQLGADRKTQIFSAFLAGTIPLMLLEGSSAKNHILSAAWLLIGISFLLKLRDEFRPKNILFLSSAIGLALLTKTTALFIFPPFLLLPFCRIPKPNVRQSFLYLMVSVLLISGINSGYLFRLNQIKTLSEQMIIKGQIFVEADPSPLMFITNGIRHLVVELGTPWLTFNQALVKMTIAVHSWLGVPCPFADKPFSFPCFPFHEDHASNTLFVLLLGYAVLIFFVKGRYRKEKLLACYFLTLSAAILIFIDGVKWSPHVSRYHLSLLLPACPFMALVLTKEYSKSLLFIILLLFLAALPYTFRNPSRPLIGKGSILTTPRPNTYFYNLGEKYYSAALAVSQKVLNSPCRDIGLIIPFQEPEYPIALLLENNTRHFRIENILVENPSKKFSYPLGDFNPCAIIRDSDRPVSELNFKGKKFVPIYHENSLQLLVPLAGHS